MLEEVALILTKALAILLQPRQYFSKIFLMLDLTVRQEQDVIHIVDKL